MDIAGPIWTVRVVETLKIETRVQKETKVFFPP